MRVFAIILLTGIASALHSDAAKPIPPKDLAEFLGPVSPQVIRWTKIAGPDFDLYNGEALSPLSGHVGFYLGGHPQEFKPDPQSSTVRGRLGIFPVKWYCAVMKNGSMSQRALIRLDEYWRVDIAITARRQEDIDRLIATLSQLPTFTKKPKPFGAE
jgi:hypothetical protein